MVSFPNAKINLGLFITEKRPDGYHNLETVMVPVGWADVLEVLPAPAFSFVQTGPDIPGDPQANLCVQAYRLLKAYAPGLPPARIQLHKVVPTGAGLGGGSADAAFTLKALNEVFNLSLSEETLSQLAARLGSDCAFFIRNQPQFCSQRGECCQPLALPLLAGHQVLLVHPGFGSSTAEAYAGVQPRPNRPDLRQLLARPLPEWAGQLSNDFEVSLFPKYPELARLKAEMYAVGAEYAAMSGSGSVMFGIFGPEAIIPMAAFAGKACYLHRFPQ